MEALSGVLQDMLRLAEIEKTSQLLAEEIEKTAAGSTPWSM